MSNEVVEKNSLGLKTAFRDAAASAMQSALSEIADNWEGALAGDNIDAVHDLRVGTRRLRAALSVYAAALPTRSFRRAERAVEELTDVIGPARDADVLIEHLTAVAEKYAVENADEALGVTAFIDQVRKTRAREQTALDKALRGFDLDQLKDDLASTHSFDERKEQA